METQNIILNPQIEKFFLELNPNLAHNEAMKASISESDHLPSEKSFYHNTEL